MTRSGRKGTGNARYRRNRAVLLARNDVCALCSHPGSRTADHVVSARDWPRDADGKHLPGLDDLDNLQPAHGTLGPYQPPNPCPTCGKLCNQIKGAGQRRPSRPQSVQWL